MNQSLRIIINYSLNQNEYSYSFVGDKKGNYAHRMEKWKWTSSDRCMHFPHKHMPPLSCVSSNLLSSRESSFIITAILSVTHKCISITFRNSNSIKFISAEIPGRQIINWFWKRSVKRTRVARVRVCDVNQSDIPRIWIWFLFRFYSLFGEQTTLANEVAPYNMNNTDDVLPMKNEDILIFIGDAPPSPLAL